MEYPEFRELAEQMREYAMRLLVEDKYHTQILMVFTPEWKMILVDMIGRPKDLPMRDAIRAVTQTLEVVAFITIGEAWMVKWDPEHEKEYGKRPEGGELEGHPLRQEVLQTCAVHPGGKIMWAVPFSKEGERIVYGKIVESEGMNLEGGIPNALRRSFD